MKIQLVQAEIEEALEDFIRKQGINLDGKAVQITFTAGRGNNGMTADLDIEPVQPTQFTNTPVKVRNPVLVAAPTSHEVNEKLPADLPFEVECAEGPAEDSAEELPEDTAESVVPVVEKKSGNSLFS